MNEKETPERRKTLYQSCEPLLTNPFCRKLIETAPSPHAIDAYLKKLGWPDSTARSAKDGVRLRDMIGSKEFNSWAESDTRPATTQFFFGHEAREKRFGLRPAKLVRFGNDQASVEHWPFLCRELASGDVVPDLTSFDGEGDDLSDSSYQLDHPLEEGPVSEPGDPMYEKTFRDTKLQIELKLGRIPVVTKIKLSDPILEIRAYSTKVKGEDTPFPQFMKILKLRSGSRFGNEAYDEIIVALRQDIGSRFTTDKPNHRNYLGLVCFDRLVPVNEAVEARMRVVWDVASDLSLSMRDSRQEGRNILEFRLRRWETNRTSHYSSLDSTRLPDKRMGEITGYLANYYAKFVREGWPQSSYKTKKPNNLGSLVGLDYLLKDRQRTLGDLFLPED